MASKDFQNGFAVGLASGGVVKTSGREEQEKTITIAKNGTTEITPDKYKTLSKVTVNVDVDVEPEIVIGEDILDHTVTFMVKDELYEVVSVKDGNAVRVPGTDPAVEGFNFRSWGYDENNQLIQPFVPTEDTTLIALDWALGDLLWNAYGIDSSQYPYIYIGLGQTVQLNFYNLYLCFLPSYELLDSSISTSGGIEYTGRVYHSALATEELQDPQNIIKYLANNVYTTTNEISSGSTFGGQVYTYTNFECKFGDTVGIGYGHTRDVAHYIFD